jgi:hypothetical protein
MYNVVIVEILDAFHYLFKEIDSFFLS